jgi:hypothetical protein
MGLLGGIVKSFINPATLMSLAMGPAGWASLAVRTIGSAVGQAVLQQLGQQLGLPQSMISAAQHSLATATGTQNGTQSVPEAVNQLAAQWNLSPAQTGEFARAVNQQVDDLLKNVLDNAINGNNSVGDEVNSRAEGKGKSWLSRLADVMSKSIEDKMGDLEKLAKTAKNGASETNQFQVASQEFSLLMNTTTTAIKAIGEALGNMARKQ